MEHGFILREDNTGYRVYMVSEAVCRATAGEDPADKTVEKENFLGFVPKHDDGSHLAAFLNRHHVWERAGVPLHGAGFTVDTVPAEEEDPEDVRLPMMLVSVLECKTRNGRTAHFNKKGYPSRLMQGSLTEDDVDKETHRVTFPPKSQLNELPGFIRKRIEDGDIVVRVDYDVEKREVYVTSTVVFVNQDLNRHEVFAEDSPIVYFK